MKETAEKRKELLIRLIKQDLVHYKFIHSLNLIQLIPDAYILEIEDVIYELMGLDGHPEIDMIYDKYMEYFGKAVEIPIDDAESLMKLAEEIYTYLESCRKVETEGTKQHSENYILGMLQAKIKNGETCKQTKLAISWDDMVFKFVDCIIVYGGFEYKIDSELADEFYFRFKGM